MDVRKDDPPAYNTNFTTNYEQTPTNQYAANQTMQYNYRPPPGQGQIIYNYSAPPTSSQGQVNYSYSTGVIVTQPAPHTVIAGTVPDQMVLAIIATFLFWPIGLFAILKANEARHCLARGDIAAALTNSSDARRISLVSIVVGSLTIIGAIIGIVVVSVSNATTYTYYG